MIVLDNNSLARLASARACSTWATWASQSCLADASSCCAQVATKQLISESARGLEGWRSPKRFARYEDRRNPDRLWAAPVLWRFRDDWTTDLLNHIRAFSLSCFHRHHLRPGNLLA